MKTPKHRRLFTVILTGLSGAGKSVALNALEDSGFFCVDNLPTSLIKSFADLCCKTPSITRIAFGMDVRERKFLADFSGTVSALKKKHKVEIIFLEAAENVLIRRFKETRRPHPLGFKDLRKAIDRERCLMSDIRKAADKIIDTSPLSPHDLRRVIKKIYTKEEARPLSVTLISFGYKYGIPAEADILFDVRFLPNPNFIEGLKHLTGITPKLRKFVLKQKDTMPFLDRLYSLLNYTIPLYAQEGRSYLTIGVGCTGGRHRSPALIEEIKKFFKNKKIAVMAVHRDLG